MEQWGKTINRMLKIFPVLRQYAVQDLATSCIELVRICMGASFCFGDQCCVSGTGYSRVPRGDHQPCTALGLPGQSKQPAIVIGV